jgi:hypothetical protein
LSIRRRSPRNTSHFKARVLCSDPVPKLDLEPLLSSGTAGLVVISLQGVVVLSRKDHGIELTRLFHEHRLALGLGRQAAESVLASVAETRMV